MSCEKLNPHHQTTSEVCSLLILILLTGHLWAAPPLAQDTRETSFTLLQPLNDALFAEDVLLEPPSRSRLECGKQCAETGGCAMCTFHHSGSSDDGDGGGGEGPPSTSWCRLFGKVHSLTGSAYAENSSGARSYGLTGGSTAESASCPAWYDLECGRCLVAVQDLLSYAGAQHRCRELDGGELVLTKTIEDAKCVGDFAYYKEMKYPWVGADDRYETGQYLWMDSTDLPPDSPLWHTKDQTASGCVVLVVMYGKLKARSCSIEGNFICQKTS